MKLSDLSIHRPVFSAMLMLSILLFGYLGYKELGISQYPDVEFPIATVYTVLTGASPEVIENDVTEVIEKAVSSIQGVRTITSQSVQGASIVTIEFELNRPIDVATQDVRDKVSAAQRELPLDVEPPIISKVNPDDHPIMWVAVYGTRPYQEISDYAENELVERLQVLKGVGDIMTGRQKREIRIWIDPQKMEAYGLTVEDVYQALSRQHIETPAGRVESKMIEFNVRLLGEMVKVKDLNQIIVAKKENSPVYLEDIAIIEDGLEDKRTLARYNKYPAAGLGILKQRGENTVAVAKAVNDEIAKIQKELPEGIKVTTAFDSSTFIEDSIHEIQFTMILSVIVTAVVCYFFLLSLRSTIIVAVAMPLSIMGAFGFMHFFGFTLNNLTLLGISLSVGAVVDDAIIVLENIYRHREMGEGQIEGAVKGASEITFAALACTIAIVAIFLPVAFMKGIIGRFFFEFGITVSVAILISYVVALSLTPMLCSRFLHVGEAQSKIMKKISLFIEGWTPLYQKILPYCLKHRLKVFIVASGIFIASLLLVGVLNKEFAPAEDRAIVLLNINCPVGSSVDYTDQMLKKCEKIVGDLPEVKGFFSVIGFGEDRLPNKGIMFITLVPVKDRKKSQDEIMRYLREKCNSFPGMQVIPWDLASMGFTAGKTFPIDFSIQGPDLNRLAEISMQFMKEMSLTSGILDVDSDYDLGMPEIQVEPDRKKASDMGIDSKKIGDTLNMLLGGVKAAKYKDKGKRYDINIRLQYENRNNPKNLEYLKIRNDQGVLIPLSDIVTLVEKPSLLKVNRYNRQRSISITANLGPEMAQEKALKEIEKIAKKILPEHYKIEFGGAAKTFQESFRNLVFALFLGIIVAYMVLGAQFNHFIHPLTVLTALPFSLTGALIGMWITHTSLNIYSMIGIILLMGLVKKNSIILVDYTNQLRAAGKSREDALLEACPIRLRPILMTSFAIIVGAVPAVLQLGPGAESRSPMAVTIIGGVLVSTFLTLLVVPVIYTYLDDFSQKIAPFFHHHDHHKTQK